MAKGDFGKALRELRKKRGLTAEQLAKKVGVDRTYISKIENGIITPGIQTVISISRHLGPSDCYDLYLIEKYPSFRHVFKKG